MSKTGQNDTNRYLAGDTSPAMCSVHPVHRKVRLKMSKAPAAGAVPHYDSPMRQGKDSRSHRAQTSFSVPLEIKVNFGRPKSTNGDSATDDIKMPSGTCIHSQENSTNPGFVNKREPYKNETFGETSLVPEVTPMQCQIAEECKQKEYMVVNSNGDDKYNQKCLHREHFPPHHPKSSTYSVCYAPVISNPHALKSIKHPEVNVSTNYNSVETSTSFHGGSFPSQLPSNSHMYPGLSQCCHSPSTQQHHQPFTFLTSPSLCCTCNTCSLNGNPSSSRHSNTPLQPGTVPELSQHHQEDKHSDRSLVVLHSTTRELFNGTKQASMTSAVYSQGNKEATLHSDSHSSECPLLCIKQSHTHSLKEASLPNKQCAPDKHRHGQKYLHMKRQFKNIIMSWKDSGCTKINKSQEQTYHKAGGNRNESCCSSEASNSKVNSASSSIKQVQVTQGTDSNKSKDNKIQINITIVQPPNTEDRGVEYKSSEDEIQRLTTKIQDLQEKIQQLNVNRAENCTENRPLTPRLTAEMSHQDIGNFMPLNPQLAAYNLENLIAQKYEQKLRRMSKLSTQCKEADSCPVKINKTTSTSFSKIKQLFHIPKDLRNYCLDNLQSLENEKHLKDLNFPDNIFQWLTEQENDKNDHKPNELPAEYRDGNTQTEEQKCTDVNCRLTERERLVNQQLVHQQETESCWQEWYGRDHVIKQHQHCCVNNSSKEEVNHVAIAVPAANEYPSEYQTYKAKVVTDAQIPKTNISYNTNKGHKVCSKNCDQICKSCQGKMNNEVSKNESCNQVTMEDITGEVQPGVKNPKISSELKNLEERLPNKCRTEKDDSQGNEVNCKESNQQTKMAMNTETEKLKMQLKKQQLEIETMKHLWETSHKNCVKEPQLEHIHAELANLQKILRKHIQSGVQCESLNETQSQEPLNSLSDLRKIREEMEGLRNNWKVLPSAVENTDSSEDRLPTSARSVLRNLGLTTAQTAKEESSYKRNSERYQYGSTFSPYSSQQGRSIQMNKPQARRSSTSKQKTQATGHMGDKPKGGCLGALSRYWNSMMGK